MGEISQSIKSVIDNLTFLSRDILHVYGGVIFFMLWVLVFKEKKQLICLLILFTLAIFNEILDISFYLKKVDKVNWTESISDIFNTVFLPILLFLFLGYLNSKPNK